MNHVYRVIWNDSAHRFAVVSELTTGRVGCARGSGRSRTRQKMSASEFGRSLLGAAVALALASPLRALPSAPTVAAGKATVEQSGKTLTVVQSSADVAIDWRSFSIAPGEQVDFVQPNANAVALNRVTGNGASTIDGRIDAIGQVFLINPNGVLFGRTAQVDVGGFIASTLNLSDADLFAGKRTFSGRGGSVINRGQVEAGYVGLLGGQVSNRGTIRAQLGTVALAAGSQVTLDFAGNRLLSVAVDRGAVKALAENDELIVASGGQVILTARATNALLDTVVNNTGIIEARTMGTQAGVIRLLGGTQGGTTQVGGTLDASAPGGGGGGFIETSGAHVVVAADAHVTTAAVAGAKSGDWLIDPTDFTISAGSAAQTTSGIGATTLQTNLGLGSVSIATSGSGTENGDINVNAPVSWAANTLTLTAANNININAVMTVSGTAKVDFEPGMSGDVLVGFAGDGSFAGSVNISSSAANPLTISNQIYTVITALGVAGDATTTTLQGIKNNLGGHYALGSNIDASATSGWNGGNGFRAIGSGGGYSYAVPGFTGSFNGLGHTVSNLTIKLGGYESVDNVGLFAAAQSTSRISNVGIIGSSSVIGTANTQYAGALVGTNAGSIKNSYSNVSNVSAGYSGGLVGFNSGPIVGSHANGNVYSAGAEGVGGLVGWNTGSIATSYATGNVQGYALVGGLAGYNGGPTGTISASYATGNVAANGSEAANSEYMGGLVGENVHTIMTSFATGNVSGGTAVGGLVGESFVGPFGSTIISDVYASGNVTATLPGSGSAGGLVGVNEDTINRGYSTGTVTGAMIGGFVSPVVYIPSEGFGPATITNSFWDVDTSGITTASFAGVTGMHTAAMQTMLNYQSATVANGNVNPGWNFTVAPITWKQGSNLYPCLLGISPACVVSAGTPLTVDVVYGGSVSTGTATYGSALLNTGFSYELLNGATVVTPAGVTGTVVYSGVPSSLSNVGSYDVTYSSGLAASGYSFSSGPALVFTVTPAPLAITASNASKVYGHVASLTGFTPVGLQNGETIGSVTENSVGTPATADVASSPYTITPSAASGGTFSASNYAITYVTGDLVVTPAPLTVTANSLSKLYGDTPVLTGFSTVGLENEQTIGGVTETSAGSAATAGVASGPYAITPSNASGGTFAAGNYAISYVPGALTVTPAPLTVTLSDATKIYGQTPTLTGFSAAGLKNGETVGSVTEISAGAAGTASVAGGPYDITGTGVAGGGTFAATNYTVTYVAGSLAVTPAPVTVSANDVNKVYGHVASLTGFTPVGLQNGETIGSVTENSVGTPATADVASSPYTITPSAASGGTFSASNYAITYVTGDLVVTPAPLTVTANSLSKLYGDTPVLTGFSTVGLENEQTIGGVTETSAGSAATAGVASGPYAITPSNASGGTFAAGNYAISYVPGALTVTPAPLTVTLSDATKIYGQTPTLTGFSAAGLKNGETVGSVTEISAGAAGTASVAGGPYDITGTGVAGGGTFAATNYTVTYVAGSLAVTPAPVTVSANDVNKVYGHVASLTGFTPVGLQNGETIGSVTENSVGTPATADVASSPYTITPSAASGGTFSASNYAITYVTGDLVVTPAPLTVTANSLSKLYGDTPVLTGFSTVGLENEQTIGGVTETSAGSAATAGVASGPYAITPSNASGGTFAAGNYAISYVPGALTVTPAPLTVTLSDATKIYGQTPTLTGFSAAGLKNGETVGSVTEISAGAAGTASVAGGPYDITGTGVAGGGTFAASNYTVTYVAGSLAVTPASLDVTVNESTRIVGAGNPTFSVTYEGLVAGDTASSLTRSPVFSTAANATSGAGDYTVTASAAVDPNYRFTYESGTLVVTTPPPVTVTSSPPVIVSIDQLVGDIQPSGFAGALTPLSAAAVSPAGVSTPPSAAGESPTDASTLTAALASAGVTGDFNYERRIRLNLGTTSLEVIHGGIRGPDLQ